MKYVAKKKLTVLEALQEMSPESSKNNLKSWVEKGRVTLDGLRCQKSHTVLSPGQTLEVRPKTLPVGLGVKVLYEDTDLIVIDKPPKLLTVATDGGSGRNVHSLLKNYSQRQVFPVHRLDKDTSGVLVFAYSERAREDLKEKFHAHTIEREYYALVEGVLSPAAGTWKSHLLDDANYVVRSNPHGKMAITHYEVVSQNKTVSLIRCKLETGRKNQIRVHASEAGHPIVGDRKYGATLDFVKRMCLHAHKLGFTHPVTGKKLQFCSPLPSFFKT